jgi:hypothetical protein
MRPSKKETKMKNKRLSRKPGREYSRKAWMKSGLSTIKLRKFRLRFRERFK